MIRSTLKLRTDAFPIQKGIASTDTPSADARQRIEAAIEVLIGILDAIDHDADFEPDGADEPSLGWTSTMAIGNSLDLEENVLPP